MAIKLTYVCDWCQTPEEGHKKGWIHITDAYQMRDDGMDPARIPGAAPKFLFCSKLCLVDWAKLNFKGAGERDDADAQKTF